jgi:hypothetical protein
MSIMHLQKQFHLGVVIHEIDKGPPDVLTLEIIPSFTSN